MIGAKVKVSIKKIFKAKWLGLAFFPGSDGGNPIRIAEVVVSGTAEDARPGSRITVASGEEEFAGESQVPFTGLLDQVFGLTSTVTADDDAVPPNRAEHIFIALPGWAEPD